LYEEVEHSPTQSANQGVSIPNKDQRSIKESATVQALYAEFEGQLDWPQIESSTAVRPIGRCKRGRKITTVGRGGQKGKIPC